MPYSELRYLFDLFSPCKDTKNVLIDQNYFEIFLKYFHSHSQRKTQNSRFKALSRHKTRKYTKQSQKPLKRAQK